MYIIAGLGNPGKKYENTRHNIGFITLDVIAEKLDVKVNRIKFRSLVGEASFSGRKVILVKPQTYMNLSGEALREVMNFYKIPADHLIVIYDDIDIPTGTLRIRKKGSAGTHNGMRNIVYQLNDDGFPRIRIGMGRERRSDLRDFVTGGFTKEEKPLLEEAVTKAADAALCIISEGIDRAMNRYNVRAKKPEKNKGDSVDDKNMNKEDGSE